MNRYRLALGLMLLGPLICAAEISKSVQVNAAKNIFPTTVTRAYVDKHALPQPWSYLLVQPLMTVGIENYYQRKTIIQPIIAKLDASGKKYSRCIIMLMDSRKARNNPEVAAQLNESLVAEIAFIRIKMSELPPKVVDEILHSNTPFGKILLKHNIEIMSQDQRYFSISCDQNLKILTGCRPYQVMYGRNNSLISKKNKQQLAEVTEILPKISQEMFNNTERKN